MEKKITPIAYWEFRFKYLLKRKAPVYGSKEMIRINSFLNRLICVIILFLAYYPALGYLPNQVPGLVRTYINIVLLIAIWKPVGYLLYRISFYREHRYDADV